MKSRFCAQCGFENLSGSKKCELCQCDRDEDVIDADLDEPVLMDEAVVDEAVVEETDERTEEKTDEKMREAREEFFFEARAEQEEEEEETDAAKEEFRSPVEEEVTTSTKKVKKSKKVFLREVEANTFFAKEKRKLPPQPTTKAPQLSVVSSFSVASEQGRRKNMEDVYIVNGSVQDDRTKSYFAVFDGHAGPRAAEYCGQRMLDNITSTQAWRKGDIKEATRYGIQRTEQAWLRAALLAQPRWFDGTTAVACVIVGAQVTVGWVGDSRAVLGRYSREDGGWTSESLSLDHKPTAPSERERILSVGGNIGRSVKEANARHVRAVAGARCPFFCFGAHPAAPVRCYPGGLSLSRSIGDVTLKYHKGVKCVVGDPDVHQYDLNLDVDRFIILGCDGIWDVISNDTAVAIVANAHGKKQDAAKALVRAALQAGSTDNMTVVVIKFVGPQHAVVLQHKENNNDDGDE